MEPDPGEVTRLLSSLGPEGDEAVYERLMPLVHGELWRLAAGFLRHERPDHTLQPTALVNEAFVRLAGQRSVSWESKGHFLAIAAVAMRRILVDHARARHSRKRDPGRLSPLADADLPATQTSHVDLLALDDALKALARIDPRKVRVVELRYFAGLTHEDAAAAMGLSVPTVKREWRLARLWLRAEMLGDG